MSYSVAVLRGAVSRINYLGLLAVLALPVGLAACGDSANNSATNPPYASPQMGPADSVLSRSCDKVKSGKASDLVPDVKVALIRQGTQLQRISDDLTGAVPGGNFGVDVDLVVSNAQDVVTRIKASNLCDPLKTQLGDKATALRDSDVNLKATGGGATAGSALQASLDAYAAINKLLG